MEMIPGAACGIIIWNRVRILLIPSTAAASSNSGGKLLKNACKSQIPNGTAKAVFMSAKPKWLSISDKPLNILKIGTTSSAVGKI